LQRPSSLKDIAAELGISIATVSRALQGNPAISRATRERVLNTAHRLNYTKNYVADVLRGAQLPVIGVIVPHAVTLFYSSILDGIEQQAAAEGYVVVMMNSHESYEEECRNVQHLIHLRVAGIIASVTQETADFSHFDSLAPLNIPVVFVARDIPRSLCSSVVADNVEAAHKATRHLIQQGCRRIAMLCGPSRLQMVADRRHGYIEALHDNHILVRPEYVAYSDIDNPSAIDATQSLLDLPCPPDAIIALNDILLFSAMKAIRLSGLQVPDDVALIGFSDVPYVVDVSPTLSTVEDQSHLMGEEACKLLIRHLHGDDEPHRITVPTVQKIRESSTKKSKE
jgi:DNA-binding LacI/PurR family transcriptional regulator